MISSAPDYGRLVKLLPTLRKLVDACGEVILAAEEATRIQSLGFAASAGRWKCPPLPPHLTYGNPLLEPLSLGWDERALLHEAPKSERGGAAQTARHQNGEVHLASRHPVRVPGNSKSKRPPQLSGERLDWERIEQAASKIEQALLKAGERLPKRRLQQLLWRYPATIFNAALAMLRRQDRIVLEIS